MQIANISLATYFLLFIALKMVMSFNFGSRPISTSESRQIMQIALEESFWRDIGVEIEVVGPDALLVIYLLRCLVCLSSTCHMASYLACVRCSC